MLSLFNKIIKIFIIGYLYSGIQGECTVKRLRIFLTIAAVAAAVVAMSSSISPASADQVPLHGTAAARVAGQISAPLAIHPNSPNSLPADPFIQAPTPTPSSGGLYIAGVTMAEGVNEADNSPVNPTAVYSSSATFHAVALVQNAPLQTNFTGTWYAVDVGSAAAPNTLIDSAQVITDGTRNIDFSLTPPASAWPSGLYMVEIDVNGNKAAQVFFTVQ
jgi:hypothetical protein